MRRNGVAENDFIFLIDDTVTVLVFEFDSTRNRLVGQEPVAIVSHAVCQSPCVGARDITYEVGCCIVTVCLIANYVAYRLTYLNEELSQSQVF